MILEIGRSVAALLSVPAGNFAGVLTWSSLGPGVGIRFWVGGNWARVVALPRIGGDPADVFLYGDL